MATRQQETAVARAGADGRTHDHASKRSCTDHTSLSTGRTVAAGLVAALGLVLLSMIGGAT